MTLHSDIACYVQHLRFSNHLAAIMAQLCKVRRFLDEFPCDMQEGPKRFRVNLFLMRGVHVGRWRSIQRIVNGSGAFRYTN